MTTDSFPQEDYDNMTYWHPNLQGIINDCEVYWVTILYQDGNYQDPSLETIQQWAGMYHHELVPTLQGNNATFGFDSPYIRTGVPTLWLMDENMVIQGPLVWYSETMNRVEDLFEKLLRVSGRFTCLPSCRG